MGRGGDRGRHMQFLCGQGWGGCTALQCAALPPVVAPTDHRRTCCHVSRLSINPLTNQPKRPNRATQPLTLRKPTVGPKSTT